MKISKHFINLTMLFIFGFLVVIPFGLTRPKVNPFVLGIQSQKEYYKKIIGNSDNTMIRNLTVTEDNEKDAITIIVSEGQTQSYFPIYDIINITNTPIDFVIYPSSRILGDVKDKVVTLQTGNGGYSVLYDDSSEMQGKSKIEFRLNTGEKMIIAVVVEDIIGVEKDTPLTFDLTVSKK